MEFKLKNDKTEICIHGRGAELQSLKKDGQEYLWQGDPKYWNERSPLLFPFVGRFTEGKYTYYGQEFEMMLHGFARETQFYPDEAKCSETRLCLYTEDNENTRKMYPVRFRMEVCYELTENKIRVSYTVLNKDEKNMFFGLGGHPGFRVPLEEGLCFEDYYLEFEQECIPDRIGFTKSCFLNGERTVYPLEKKKILPLTHALFDEDAIVLENMARAVTLKSKKGKRSVKISYPQMNYIGFWHAPHTKAPYVCIEPWVSLPSRQDVVEEFSQKSNLICLKQGQEYKNCWQMEVE